MTQETFVKIIYGFHTAIWIQQSFVILTSAD